jgi:hypothetical protein
MKKNNRAIRKINSPEPIDIQPVRIGTGWYLALNDYARKLGITRVAAHNRVLRGEIKVVKVGPRTVLVKVKK